MREIGNLLSRILSRVGEVNVLVFDIANRAQEQAATLKQINAAVGDMDRVTQQNAAMVEEASAAASSLAEESHRLAEIVSRLKIDQDPSGAIVTFRPKERAFAHAAVRVKC